MRTATSRHDERAALLAGVLHSSPAAAARLAQQGISRAHGRRPVTDDDLLQAFGTLAAELPDADDALGRLLLLLVDLEHRTLGEIGPLLGVQPDQARVLLDEARRRAGTAPRGAACRGWGLAAGHERLTAAERQAAEGHLQLCRRCRERLAALERTRREVLSAAAGIAVLTAGAAVAGSGTAAAAGGTLLAGKTVTALVAGLAAAVAVGGGVAAVAQSSAVPPERPPAVHAPVGAVPAPAPSASIGRATQPDCTSRCVTTSPSAVPRPATTAPVPRASVTTAAVPDPLVPSLPALPLPTLPALPLPSPSVPPLPLPTTSVLPLPSVPPLLPSLP